MVHSYPSLIDRLVIYLILPLRLNSSYLFLFFIISCLSFGRPGGSVIFHTTCLLIDVCFVVFLFGQFVIVVLFIIVLCSCILLSSLQLDVYQLPPLPIDVV